MNLYHRTCDKTGKKILSIYRSELPYTVYEHKEWYSDGWNALDYGRPFDFERTFFEQFEELMKEVPRFSLDVKSDNENCDFTHLVAGNKNCYLIFAGSENEDCIYSTYIHRSKNLCDCYFTFDSELCYECIDCYTCYQLKYSQYCDNCSFSSFLFNCKGCRDCFGCVSLVNKQYYFFNKPYSKEEYEKLVDDFRKKENFLLEARMKVDELKEEFPVKYYAGINNENVTGDHVSFSKNAFDCYDCTHLEDCRYCTWMHKSKDCYDCYGWGLTGELGYEIHLAGSGFQNLLFCESCWESVSNLIYCNLCVNGTKNCFGCIGLKAQKYCILNKQYSKEEYEELVPKIIEHMKKTQEWGEFFPARLSPFAYNETDAQLFYPRSKEEILKENGKWYDEPQRIEKKENPDEQILKCEVEACSYKIIKQELEFYHRLNIPLPKKCFKHRYYERFKIRNPRKLWQRSCDNCNKSLKSPYSSSRSEKVFCEECYYKAVY